MAACRGSVQEVVQLGRRSPAASSTAWPDASPPRFDGRALLELIADRDRFLDAVNRGEFYRLLWVRFKIIDGCNIRCVMCNHWRREEYRRGMLSRERLFALAGELRELRAKEVRWSGGEPTLRRDLPEIIARFRDHGIGSGMTTNGTLIDAGCAARLVEAGLRSIRFSIESSDPAIHDRVVGEQGAWERLVRAVAFVRAAGGRTPRISFQTVLTRLNVDDALPPLVELAARLSVRHLKLQPVVVSHLDDASLLPDETQIARLRGEYLPAMVESGRRHGVAVWVDGGDDDAPDAADDAPPVHGVAAARMDPAGMHAARYYETNSCYLPWYHCTIDHRGHVYPCCHMREEEGRIGNVVDRSLVDVLRSDLARRLRQRLLTSDVPLACQTCTMQVTENQWIDWCLRKLDASESPES